MNYILFDGPFRDNLRPFTFTRPVADIRIGILTIREKWERFLKATTTTVTEDYLSKKWPMVEMESNVMINAAFCPSKSLISQIKNLEEGQVLIHRDQFVAFLLKENEKVELENFNSVELKEDPVFIENTWDIFSKNAEAIQADFEFLTEDRTSIPIPGFVQCFGENAIFIEEGADVKAASLNAEDGPIYIGKNSKIMEGSHIRGPFALCENATLKMGAKIYGGSTIGPHSKVGGEFSNSVIFGYSNKGHDGFLGNAVIGEWCNLGADTNNSNLKNDYGDIKLWDYDKEGFKKTGLQFCGLMMGDHSKCGINTMFNTGTVIGVSANIFGGGFPRVFIPSFSWGGSNGFKTYKTGKAYEVAGKMMQRRGLSFNEIEEEILENVFEKTKAYRRW
jgi:UDP-N-acetylglucosamine diphosphorylase/glucosamine-1-phosphate N-acetyltransferase